MWHTLKLCHVGRSRIIIWGNESSLTCLLPAQSLSIGAAPPKEERHKRGALPEVESLSDWVGIRYILIRHDQSLLRRKVSSLIVSTLVSSSPFIQYGSNVCVTWLGSASRKGDKAMHAILFDGFLLTASHSLLICNVPRYILLAHVHFERHITNQQKVTWDGTVESCTTTRIIPTCQRTWDGTVESYTTTWIILTCQRSCFIACPCVVKHIVFFTLKT